MKVQAIMINVDLLLVFQPPLAKSDIYLRPFHIFKNKV